MTPAPVRLLIDGIGLASGDAADHPWVQLVASLAECDRLDLFWLDRGHAPEVAGLRYLPFPQHRKGACAADSLLIQKVCDLYGIDVFVSTGWTTPVATPMAMLIDRRGLDGATHDPALQGHGEPELALAFTQRYLCATTQVRAALLTSHPEISPQAVATANGDWTSQERSQFLPELGDQVVTLCDHLRAESRSGLYARFYLEWRRLREVQSTVDI